MNERETRANDDDLIRSFDDYLARFFPNELREKRLKSGDPAVVADQISKDAADRVKARLTTSR